MEIKTNKGLLKSKPLTCDSFQDILDWSGISDGVTNIQQAKSNLMKKIAPFIDFSGIEGVSSYEEINGDPDNFYFPLLEITEDYLVRVIELYKKKT